MEFIMGRLLQVGVLLAAAVVLAGGAEYMLSHAGELSDYRRFVPRPIQLRHAGGLIHGLARGDASAMIQAGIVLLIATPVCRVVFAVIGFALERDRLYVAVSLVVLGVLLWGLVRGG
jgi:uncharacterized membrane protein